MHCWTRSIGWEAKMEVVERALALLVKNKEKTRKRK